MDKFESKSYKEAVSLESQARLMQILNNSPSIVKLNGTEWELTALKKGTQWLIAEEICKIENIEVKNAGEAFKAMTKSMPSVIRILTLALLNDKERIEKEYDTVYNTIEWESTNTDWNLILKEIFMLIDVGFFLQITEAVRMLKDMTTRKKMTMKEELSLLAQNGGK